MYKLIAATVMCLCLFPISVYADQHDKESPALPLDKMAKPETPPIPAVPENSGRPYGMIFPMTKNIQCNDTQVVENAMEHIYNEAPMMLGMVRNKHGMAQMIMVLYVNPQSRSYTIVEHSVSGVSCLLTSGHEFDYHPDSIFRPREDSLEALGPREERP